jgi:hydroxyacylglutathione hydrolase
MSGPGRCVSVIFQQFSLPSLGHASYLVGDEQTGQALVFDPRRDVEVYLDAARQQGLRVTYAVDSHGHNDYLSGLSELQSRTGAELWASATGELGYVHRPLEDGEVIEIGDVGIEVLHTPGHTPEHISLLVYDRSVSADTPAMMLSGGALLVGDLGRPDLLGEPDQAREAAKMFCETVQTKLLPLPDHVEVFPTHVAGSLCGGSIGSRLSTTLGYERRTNPVLAELDPKDALVRDCLRLDNLPAVPPYWRRMRAQNLAGVAPLGTPAEPPALTVTEVAEQQESGVLVLDTRAPEAFGGGHAPGALNVGLGSAFATWAGTVLPDHAEVVLVLDRTEDLWEVTWHLLRIGYPLPRGWLSGGMTGWRTAARPVETTPQITVHELQARLQRGEVDVLDVRQPDEWQAGHVPGATHITGAELPDRHGELADLRPVAAICGSGYRSSVAASLLAHHGRTDIVNVTGGMAAWRNAGYPLTGK